jgi:hypothetical protein
MFSLGRFFILPAKDEAFSVPSCYLQLLFRFLAGTVFAELITKKKLINPFTAQNYI